MKVVAVDVLLLDLCLPGRDGLDLVPEIRAEFPSVKILIMSMRADRGTVDIAIQSGAHGYIPKDDPLEHLVNAVHEVAEGRRYISRTIPPHTVRPGLRGLALGLERLTPRQVEIVGYIAAGLDTEHIAQRVFLSAYTISSHRKNIIHRLGLKNEAGLVRWATLVCATGGLDSMAG